MQACPGCGTAIAETGRFCPACGAVRGEPDAGPRDALALAQTATRASATGSLIGCRVGDFMVDAVIGGGSFGTVYRGRQLGLDRPVAIKVPTHEIAADPVQARRFAREARAAARIVHPGVVAIYAVGELDDGRPYLAMQLIDGEPLDRILAEGPLPPVRALRIARAIASALSETHAAGVVHRDLKPSNVMWRRDRNGDDRITLVDFGIAVCRPGNADATRLTTGGLIGTPHYMSPEQAHGEHVDARADLYALGCLVFELVTGETPFEGAGFEVVLAHLGRPVPRASERSPHVPGVIDRLIARLMQKRPDDRPAGADAVVAMIDETLATIADGRGRGSPRRGGETQPGPLAVGPQAAGPRPHLRRRIAAAALAALALSGAAVAAYRLRGGEPDVDARERSAALAVQPVAGSAGPLRMIARDDGELIVRTTMPALIRAGVPVEASIEIKNKYGGQFSASQVVVTIEDPHHRATAQTAAIQGGRPGHYAFRHTFAEPGPYVVRIFPSGAETVSTIDLEVMR